MAGLPIIVSNMKEMAAIVNKFSAGSVMVENSAEELNFKINYLINSDLTEGLDTRPLDVLASNSVSS